LLRGSTARQPPGLHSPAMLNARTRTGQYTLLTPTRRVFGRTACFRAGAKSRPARVDRRRSREWWLRARRGRRDRAARRPWRVAANAFRGGTPAPALVARGAGGSPLVGASGFGGARG